MSTSCPGPDLLLIHREGLLEDDASDVQTHLAGCAKCQAQLGKLGEALEPPPLPFPSSELLAGIQARIEAERVDEQVREQPPEVEGVHVRCTFCKDDLGGASIYCADCLAPYHDDCFAEHGRCAIAGCEGREVVRRGAAPVVLPPQRRGSGPWLVGVVLLGGAAAAWTAWPGAGEAVRVKDASEPAEALRSAPPSETVTREQPQDSTADAYEPARYAVGDLLAEEHPEWVDFLRGALLRRKVTYSLDECSLGVAADYVSETSGLRVMLQDVDSERLVSLRGAGIPLVDALEQLCDEAGLRASLENESVVLSPSALSRGAPLRGGFDERLTPAAFLLEVRAAARQALGADAWASPASLELRGQTLEVVQTGAGHSAVRGLIGALRATWLRDLERAWFLPTGEQRPATDPQAAAMRTRVSVDCLETPLLEVLERFERWVSVRVTAEARTRCAGETVTLKLSNISLQNALALVLDQTELQYDVGPLGVEVHAPGELSGSERLERAVARSLRAGRSVVERRADDPSAAERLREPFGDAAWGVSVPAFAERVRVALGVRVALSPRARASRARLAIPAGQSVGAALELAGLQASLASGWVELDGHAFLALGPSEPEALLAAVRAAGRPGPWLDAPAAARAPFASLQDELREGLRRLAALEPGRVEPRELRVLLVVVRELEDELEDVRRAHRALAGVETGRAALAKLLADDQGQVADWTRRATPFLARRARIANAPFAPSGYAALAEKRAALLTGQAWDAVFPAGYAAWRAGLGPHTLERGLRHLDALGLALHEDGSVRGLRPDGLARACGLDEGDRVRVVGAPAGDALQLLETLGGVNERLLDLALRRGESELRVRIPLRPRAQGQRGSLPLRMDSAGVVASRTLGALREGDRVVRIDGVDVRELWLADQVLACHAPGTTITIKVRRGDVEIEIEVTVEPPPPPPEPTEPAATDGATWLATRRRLRRDLAREGGSLTTEAAVEAALDWLARHQHPDGWWSEGYVPEACPADERQGPGWQPTGHRYRVGVTSLALLAFFGRGETQLSTPEGDRSFRPTIERALSWLLEQQAETGALGYDPGVGESIYNHAYATQALCEAYGLTGDPRLREPALRALDFCLAAQNPNLGWKYGIKSGRNDSSVTGAMLQALIGARRAGLAVPDAAFAGGVSWLRKATDREGHTGYESPGGGSAYLPMTEGRYELLPVMSGVALASRLQLGERSAASELRRLANVLDDAKPTWGAKVREVNFFHWYWKSLACFHHDGERWQN